ncbi:thermonuclease family protein [Patescibacteria group bacterium]|nr:thermonuclease family protein [Patescibacteria group bacterium]MBU1931862.1 thermonuclease family protein [Patescibacteria group bacterium]
MKNKLPVLLLALISLVSLGLNGFFYYQNQEDNRVVEVVDGDTFQLKSGKRVRLMGVDAPEYDRCGGEQAKARLKELILDQRVQLREEVTEAYGRSLALVYVDRRFINEIMMTEGWGRIDYRKNSQRQVLTDSFHQAQEAKLGIHSDLCRQIGQTPDPDCVIKGNIDLNTYEKFYHLPGCSHYNQVVMQLDVGDQYFCTEAEASAAGFTKASACP